MCPDGAYYETGKAIQGHLGYYGVIQVPEVILDQLGSNEVKIRVVHVLSLLCFRPNFETQSNLENHVTPTKSEML